MKNVNTGTNAGGKLTSYYLHPINCR